MFNTKNPVGQEINIDGSASQAWMSYVDNYEKASDMARLNAEQNLRNITYSNNTDFDAYITIMHNKWSSAKALGANISDKNFKNIVINSLLSS